MDLLRSFNGDVRTKEALIGFILDFIDQEGLRRIYAKEDVTSVADARTLIDGAFEALALEYAIPERPKEPTNVSR